MRVPILALLWVLASPAPTLAQAPRSIADALTVVGEVDACLDHLSLGARLAGWLGQSTVAADLSFEVSVETDGHASFSLHRGGERAAFRSFDVLPESCDSRRDAVSLALALAIDHTVLDRIRGRGPGSPDSQDPGPASDPPPPADPAQGGEPVRAELTELPPRTPGPPVTPAEPHTPLHLRGAIGGGPLLSALSQPVAAGRIGLELAHDTRGGLTMEVRVSGQMTTQTRLSLGAGAVHAWLPSGRIDGCLGGHAGALALGACAGLAAGVLLAQGDGFLVDRSTSLPWVAVAGALWARVPREGAVALRLGVDVMGVLVVPELVIADGGGEEVQALALSRLALLPVAEIVWTWR